MDIIYRYEPGQPGDFPRVDTAEEAQRALLDGNRRYGTIVEKVQAEFRDGDGGRALVIPTSPLSLGFPMVPGQAPTQKPFALILGCSDARAPIELVFDQSSNDLFVVRVAGNVVGSECLGSIEYAVRHLAGGLRLVAVLGHTGCGAVAAAVDIYLNPDAYGSIAETHGLRSIIDRVLVAVRIADKALLRRRGPSAPAEPGYRAALWEMSVYLNAARTAQDLARELGLDRTDGRIRVVFGVYDLVSLRVGATPGDESAFAPAPRDAGQFTALGDRLADRMQTAGILRPVDV